MKATRRPAVAGLFYPDDPDELRGVVNAFLEEAEKTAIVPKALIAPHAGYPYSGPIAGSAYAALQSSGDTIRRVVLLGPSHRVAIRGLAAPEAHLFAMPFGDVTVDRPAIEGLLDLPQVLLSDLAHAEEHSLEVQLPFLQTVVGDFTLVPLVVGSATPEEVEEVLDRLWDGPETLIVVSSDLSHYENYDAARRMDENTSKAIETLNPDAIGPPDACGRVPLQGLLMTARKKGLSAHCLDLRSSGDTAGPRDQVVGYGAYAFG